MTAEVEAGRRFVRGTLELERPRYRRECTFCESCQRVRDGSYVPPEGVYELTCGHHVDEAIFHSRPCVFVSCRHTNYLDVTDVGSIKLAHPELEPGDMPLDTSCSIDVGERGGLTLEEVGEVMGIVRERARQLEVKALLTYRMKGGGKLGG